MTIQWVFAFIDRPAEGFEAASAFWSTVLKWTVSSRRGDHDEVATLLPPDGDAYVKLQAVGAGGGMHLDLACSDRTLVRAWHEKNGATVVAEHPLWTVMRDPAGGVYCLTPRDPSTGRLA